MPKIDELDSKILKNLLKDGRTSYYEISKFCGVSENKVWKHYRAMEKKGIIVGATVQMNFSNFGYDVIATLLISVEAHQIEEIIEFLGKMTEAQASREYNGVYNVRVVAPLRDLNELDSMKQLIIRKSPLMGLKTYIWTGVRNIPENLNLTLNETVDSNQSSSARAIQVTSGKIEIDEFDMQILAKLSLEGRTSFTKIGKEIGLSTDTVLRRYRKLREKGTMKVSIQINPSKIGYSSILDFNVSFATSTGLSNSIVELLSKIPDVIVITKTSGDHDLQLTAMIRNVSQSFVIQDQIARIRGVTKIEVTARKIPDKLANTATTHIYLLIKRKKRANEHKFAFSVSSCFTN